MIRILNWLLLLLILSFSYQTQAKDSPLKECKNLQTQIDRYREKRRKGGTGAKMSKWKQQLGDLKTDYRDGRCWRFGAKLRS